MNIGTWLRRLFSSDGGEEEAAAREEYGVRDRGRAELDFDRDSSRYGATDAARVAEHDLDEP